LDPHKYDLTVKSLIISAFGRLIVINYPDFLLLLKGCTGRKRFKRTGSFGTGRCRKGRKGKDIFEAYSIGKASSKQ